VPKNTLVWYTVYTIHRRPEYFGADPLEFRPERWETLRPGWEYLPFNGGPRICIGQQFALTEAASTTIRILQEFTTVQCVPGEENQPWREG
jgi:cytochrome P450